jgi:Alginate lyase
MQLIGYSRRMPRSDCKDPGILPPGRLLLVYQPITCWLLPYTCGCPWLNHKLGQVVSSTLTLRYLTLPYSITDDLKDPRDIHGVALKTFQNDNYFRVIDGWVSFVSTAYGATTKGAEHTRSELRETIDNFYDPKVRNVSASYAAWDASKGTHSMEAKMKVNALPPGYPR